jgi:Icc protein
MVGNDDGTLRVIQISDTHIHAVSGARLWGVDVDQGLSTVLENLTLWHWPADLLLNTGDLVQDEGQPAYERLLDFLEPLEVPVYCLPGNHDIPMILDGVLAAGNVRRERHVIHGPWQFILLDSTRPNSPGGHLAEKELLFLEQTLEAHPDRYAIVCLHHQPVPVGSAWLDTMMVDNAQGFFHIIDRHPHVRAVVWGHIHQDFSARRNGIELLGAPSTCVQFKPGAAKVAVDDIKPGYRWFRLHAEGSFETGVERVS